MITLKITIDTYTLTSKKLTNASDVQLAYPEVLAAHTLQHSNGQSAHLITILVYTDTTSALNLAPGPFLDWCKAHL